MEKKFKIIILVVIAFIAVVGVGVIISALNAPESIEMDGQTWYVGDVIHTCDKLEGSQGMVIISINHDDNSFISESPDGNYKMKWDATTGLGEWTIYKGEVNQYLRS
ncbi:MAG: hypothetical protein ISP01_00545 [Methanobrevibacter arboriphilus]|uniref:Uncharacterized protein n=1 Tax=Methanobrevibacter arboriphilus TaxID=39441 RepID=A0A843AKG9_METAZ|nr:hypothetical protein [Methanobrevibacter arboriphilus]MBF4467869.1 hypothetical protein [Methanobrevibacter arboriphilus]